MMRKFDDEAWYALADEEVGAVRGALPAGLRERLDDVLVTLERWPPEGDEEDLLGLFVGSAYCEEVGALDVVEAPRIMLFVENLRDEAGDDEEAFRQEVRTTLLHEFGHYLGLDEEGLAARGLE